MPDVTFGEPRLLVCPASEWVRHAHPGTGMFIVEAPPGIGALRLSSRTVMGRADMQHASNRSAWATSLAAFLGCNSQIRLIWRMREAG